MTLKHHCLVLLFISLIACSEKQADKQTGNTSNKVSNNSQTTETKQNANQELDLSLPEKTIIDFNDIDKTSSALEEKEPLLPDLFDQNVKDKKLSVSAKPTLSKGGDAGSVPEVTGGEVDIELKLP